MTPPNFRSGFAAIIGAPNVGKSTLLNQIMGQKIAITSPKPQTTRNQIIGVWTSDQAQVVFFDTPGIHKARDLLNIRLMNQALAVIPDADLIILMVDPEVHAMDHSLVMGKIKEHKKPIILAFNKVDKMNKDQLLPALDNLNKKMPLACMVPISALTGDGVERLLDEIVTLLPEGPLYYPADTVTDQPERLIAAEMVREQVFRMTRQEIPYSTAVTVEDFDESRDDLIRIQAVIHVERDSQKGMVIGKKGEMLKKIGTAARLDIERLTGVRVFLELFVRVEKNWSRDPRALSRFGYGQDS